MKMFRIPKATLCFPATKPISHSAITRKPDAFVVDLEDSVPSHLKEEARSLLSIRTKELREFAPTVPIFCRINSPRKKHGIDDLLEICNGIPEIQSIHIPKVESADDVTLAKMLFSTHDVDVSIQIIIESAKGLANLNTILAVCGQVDAVVFGAADFALDIGTEPEWNTLAMFRTELVKVCKLNRVPVIDSPYFNLDSTAGLQHECSLCVQLGYSGKMAIHPAHVPVIQDAFMPTAEKLHEALEIVKASVRSTAPVFRLHGRMVGPPIVEAAKHLLLDNQISWEHRHAK